MKIKLDENLPHHLVKLLASDGHDVDTVAQEGLTGKSDAEVWDAAKAAQRLFITQDMDFSDLRRFEPGTHTGIVLLHLRDSGREALFRKVEYLLRGFDLAQWQGCFVVVTDHKVRVRRPRP